MIEKNDWKNPWNWMMIRRVLRFVESIFALVGDSINSGRVGGILLESLSKS